MVPEPEKEVLTVREPGSADDPLWYKDALIYEIHVRAFKDSNGDGSEILAACCKSSISSSGPRRHMLCGCCPSSRRRSRTTVTTYPIT